MLVVISDNFKDLSDILVDEEVAEELNVAESCRLCQCSLKYGCESASCAEILPFGSNFSIFSSGSILETPLTTLLGWE